MQLEVARKAAAEEARRASEVEAGAEGLRQALDKASADLADLHGQCASLRGQTAKLQEDLVHALRAYDLASERQAAAEAEVAPLRAEVARLHAAMQEANADLVQRRLEVEAQRMAHYDQARELQRLKEQMGGQAAELEKLQLRLAMGGARGIDLLDSSEPLGNSATSLPAVPTSGSNRGRGSSTTGHQGTPRDLLIAPRATPRGAGRQTVAPPAAAPMQASLPRQASLPPPLAQRRPSSPSRASMFSVGPPKLPSPVDPPLRQRSKHRVRTPSTAPPSEGEALS